MAVHLQVGENYSRVQVFWDLDTTGTVAGFNLYWADVKTGTWTKVNGGPIRNTPSYGRVYVDYIFTRASIGVPDDAPFFLRATEVDTLGVESAPGPSKHFPDYRNVPNQSGAVNSPVLSSELYSQLVPTAATKITFSNDAKAIEIYNNSAGNLYLDVTGSQVDPATGMIIPSTGYYSAQINIPKDTGISVYASAAPADIRIVVHY